MFTSPLDWIWMALAIAVGTACAKYVPILFTKAAKLIASAADKVQTDE